MGPLSIKINPAVVIVVMVNGTIRIGNEMMGEDKKNHGCNGLEMDLGIILHWPQNPFNPPNPLHP
jgi:hypothetical protein